MSNLNSRCCILPLLSLLLAATVSGGCGDEQTTEPDVVCIPDPPFVTCPCQTTFDCADNHYCVGGFCQDNSVAEREPDAGDAGDGRDLRDTHTDPDLQPDGPELDVEDSDESTDQDTEDQDVDGGSDPDLEPDPDSGTDPDSETDPELVVCSEDGPEEADRPNDTCQHGKLLREAISYFPDPWICPVYDDDWYRLDAGDICHSNLCLQVLTDGDLDISLYEGENYVCAGIGAVETEPDLIEGGYEICIDDTGSGSWYYLEVQSETAAGVEYSLEYSPIPLPCTDDDSEPNNACEEADPISAGAANYMLCDRCDGETDWFQFTAEAGETALITLTYDPVSLGGDLSLFFHTDCGAARTPGTTTTDGGTVETTILQGPLPAGDYSLEITPGALSDSPFGEYTLALSLVSAATCNEIDLFHEDDDTEEQARTEDNEIVFDHTGACEAPNLSGLIMCEDEFPSRDIFAFQLVSGDRATFDIEYSFLEDPLKVWVYPADTTPGAEHLVQPSAPGLISIDYFARVGEWHYIKIEPGPYAMRNYYQFTTCERSLCTSDSFEPNDRANDAFSFGVEGVEGMAGTLCWPTDIADWYNRDVDRYRYEQIAIGGNSTLDLAISLFYAPLVPSPLHCDEDSNCSGAARCLGEAGCLLPIEGGTLAAGPDELLELEHWSATDGGDYLLLVEPVDPADMEVPGSLVNYIINDWDSIFRCPEDSFGDNHSVEDAYRLDSGPTGPSVALLCNMGTGIEDDYFEVEVPAGSQSVITVSTEPGDRVALDFDCGSTPSVATTPDTGLTSAVLRNPGPETIDACFRMRGVPKIPGDGVVPYVLTTDITPIDGPCLPDDFEVNDYDVSAHLIRDGESWVNEAVLVSNQLTLCGDHEDFFRFSATVGDTVVVDTTFDEAFGAVDLELYGPCELVCFLESNDPIAVSTSTNGGSQLAYVVSEEDGMGKYVVRVRPHTPDEGFDQRYALAIGIYAGCNPDDDPYEPNDRYSSAVPGPDSGDPNDLALCAAGFGFDSDWFVYHLHRDDVITVDATFATTFGNIDLALWHGDELIADSITLTDNENLNAVTIEQSDEYYLEVYSPDGADNTYNLTVSVDESICTTDRFEPNPSWSSTALLAPGFYDNLYLCHHEEDWYAFELADSGQLSFDLLGRADSALDDLVMEIYQPNVDAEEATPPFTELWADTMLGGRPLDTISGPEEGGSLDPGIYYVRVFQRPGTELFSQVLYSLDLQVTPADFCTDDHYEHNDTSDTAVRVYPNGPVEGRTCGQDVDWFHMYAFAGQEVTATLTVRRSELDQPVVAIYPDPALDPPEPPQLSSTYTATENGEVYFEVQPNDSELGYVLTVTATGADDVCAGEPADDHGDRYDDADPVGPDQEGHLCDEVDFFSQSGFDNNDLLVRVDLLFDWEREWPDLEIEDSAESSFGSGEPIADGALRGWIDSDGSPATMYYRVSDDSELGNNGPYHISTEKWEDCAEDNSEPNGGFGDSIPWLGNAGEADGALANLTLCPNQDLDAFQITVEDGDRVNIQAQIISGDVLLRLFDDMGVLLAESNRSIGAGDPETAFRPKETLWVDAESSGEYYIEVFSPTGEPSQYDLFFTTGAEGEACLDDDEDPGDGRSFENPVDVAPETHVYDLRLCAGQSDWYITDEPIVADTLNRIAVWHDFQEADIDIEIYDTADIILAESHGLDNDRDDPINGEVLTYTVTETRHVVFRVYIDNGSFGTTSDYTLETDKL